jgi:hypothetical protein
MAQTTTIQLEEATAERLRSRKRGGETYDDVIRRLLASGEHRPPTPGERVGNISHPSETAPVDGAPVEIASDTSPDDETPSAELGDMAAVRRALNESVDELELPGRNEGATEARRDAVREMVSLILDHTPRPVSKDRLLGVVDVEEVGYGSARSFWSNAVKGSGDKRNALTSLEGIREGAAQGTYLWEPTSEL